MKNYLKKSSIVFFLTISLLYFLKYNDPIYAQSIKGQNKKVASRYLTSAFDTSLNQIGANFAGHNLKELYTILKLRQEKLDNKNEFETSNEYLKRQSDEVNKPILGNIFIENTLSFIIKDCSSIYDADLGSFKVMCPFSIPRDFEYPSADDRKIQWKAEDVEDDSYSGTNAFGAAVNVHRSKGKYYNIAFINHSDFSIDRIESDITSNIGLVAQFNLSAVEAKKVKSNLSALVVCKLISPYISQHNEYERATFDYPFENDYQFYRVHVMIIQLWFVDYSTGKVYCKITPNYKK